MGQWVKVLALKTQPEFSLQDPHDGGENTLSSSCPLTSTYMLCHISMCMCMHTMHIQPINLYFKNQNKVSEFLKLKVKIKSTHAYRTDKCIF